MPLFESLSSSYEYLITILKMMSIKNLRMEYVTVHLMHKMSKRKKKEVQGDDATMLLRQGKANNLSWHKDVKTCYYCGKPDYIMRYKTKNDHQESINNTKVDDDYTFATQHGTHSKTMYKWIMDS